MVLVRVALCVGRIGSLRMLSAHVCIRAPEDSTCSGSRLLAAEEMHPKKNCGDASSAFQAQRPVMCPHARDQCRLSASLLTHAPISVATFSRVLSMACGYADFCIMSRGALSQQRW